MVAALNEFKILLPSLPSIHSVVSRRAVSYSNHPSYPTGIGFLMPDT